MIKLTNRTVATNGNFVSAMAKLLRHQCNPKLAYQIKKMWDAIDKERNKVQADFQVMAEKFAKKDDNGKVIVTPEGNIDIPEDQMPAFKEAEKTFGDTEVLIDRFPLSWDNFGPDFKLSAAELSGLECVFEPLDVVEAQNKLSAVK